MKQVLIATLVFASASAFGEEGSCDIHAPRAQTVIYAKVDTYKESADITDLVEACTGKKKAIRSCAVVQVTKREIQWPCFPGDGKPDYFESAYRVEYMELSSDAGR